jgi:hypothetical protein
MRPLFYSLTIIVGFLDFSNGEENGSCPVFLTSLANISASAYSHHVPTSHSAISTMDILTQHNTTTLLPSGAPSVECSYNSPCYGDMTYFKTGLGACGFISDGKTERVAALPLNLMGSESNNNPYCGMGVTITCVATGKTTNATIVDKCQACEGFSIDLSAAAFLELDNLSVGRTTATWFFN